ncbi:MAG: hypothetical protein KDD35_07910 [Bdellovibrionales bacterium]|nr:hypothetical protein [Bdellovibrionales bacterium]
MKRLLSLTSLLLIVYTGSSSADRASRDAYKKDIPPKIEETQNALKESCGCSVKIEIDKKEFVETSFNGAINRIVSTLDSCQAAGKKYCSDEDEKKIFCKNISKIKISNNKNALNLAEDQSASVKGGLMQLYVAGSQYTSCDKPVSELE